MLCFRNIHWHIPEWWSERVSGRNVYIMCTRKLYHVRIVLQSRWDVDGCVNISRSPIDIIQDIERCNTYATDARYELKTMASRL